MTTAITATPKDAFYSTLDYDTRQDLQTAAEYIRSGHVIAILAKIKTGKRLLEVKQQYSGVFMAWCEVEFSLHLSTLENYMSAARAFPDLDEIQAQYITERATHQLGKSTAKPDAPALALELIANEQKVTKETAYVLSYAPDYVRNGMIEGDYKEPHAYALTKAYRACEPTVAKQCEQWHVQSPLALQVLNDRYTSETSTAWHDVVADGGRLDAGEWVKPLSKVTGDDVRKWVKARQQLHIEENSTYYVMKDVTGYVDDDGRVVVTGDNLRGLVGKQVFLTVKYKGDE